MTPGGPALCEGTVLHRRVQPVEHQFAYAASQVWVDPDRPDELCRLHPAWSSRRPAPVRFRAGDYGPKGEPSEVGLGDLARSEVADVLGSPVAGPVRMLTQMRRWGWLFNPITVFFVWDDPGADPVGAVLEVTNTPWKERLRYALPLERAGTSLTATFAKALHVSPFLGMDHRYALNVRDRDDRVALDIDVIDPGDQLVVHTALRLRREAATRQALGRSLRQAGLPTHRVSAGIHAQAARLWRKGVPFVSHPRTTAPSPREVAT